jgi:SAM-dependent methyltransferase
VSRPAPVPERILTAVRCLAPTGAERVLEIGCGTGAAVGHLLTTWPGLTCTAADRSSHAVEQTRRRNARFVDEGRLTVVTAELADLTAALGHGTEFDLALAVNVNVFWTRHATHEAQVLVTHLRARARLCLVYELPDGRRQDDVGARVLRSLDVPGLRSTLAARHGHLVVSSTRLTELRR